MSVLHAPEPTVSPTASAARRLQVVLPVAAAPSLVVGVPAALRTAHGLVEHGIERLIFVVDSPLAFTRSWHRQLRPLPWKAISPRTGSLDDELEGTSPVLIVGPGGMPDADDLWHYVIASQARTTPTSWVCAGETVAVYYPEARQLPALPLGTPGGLPESLFSEAPADRLVARARSWYDLLDPEGRRRAEADLLRSLTKDSDGYLARWDRRISIALSRALMPTAATPNMITALSLLVGLLGAGLLATPGYVTSLVGAALLWSTCVLDGCDGELARLKLLATPFGAKFDVVADNIVHVAIFLALPIHLSRTHPGLLILPAGMVLLAGVLLSMLCVWWLILRSPVATRRPLDRFYERVASRDFIYVILVLAAVGRLEWFLWTAAVGAHLFWLSLCGLSWRWRR